MSVADPVRSSPFEAVGGRDGVARIVGRFYDLMETDPAYRALLAMHAPDLAPMRESLTGFLTGWMGGPRNWFTDHPGKCMMSVHGAIPITAATADQWISAMAAALRDCGVETGLTDRINAVFTDMATNMTRGR